MGEINDHLKSIIGVNSNPKQLSKIKYSKILSIISIIITSITLLISIFY
jgi:hypothetical protein